MREKKSFIGSVTLNYYNDRPTVIFIQCPDSATEELLRQEAEKLVLVIDRFNSLPSCSCSCAHKTTRRL